MIGNFVIPLGDILFEGNENTQYEINKLIDLVENINSVVENTAIPDYARTPQRSINGELEDDNKSQQSKKSAPEFSEGGSEPDMFAHLGAGKENVRSTTRALTRKRDAQKQKEKIDDERDDKIIDPNFDAD